MDTETKQLVDRYHQENQDNLERVFKKYINGSLDELKISIEKLKSGQEQHIAMHQKMVEDIKPVLQWFNDSEAAKRFGLRWAKIIMTLGGSGAVIWSIIRWLK